ALPGAPYRDRCQGDAYADSCSERYCVLPILIPAIREYDLHVCASSSTKGRDVGADPRVGVWQMSGLIAALNGPWHKRAMQVFLVIVLGHWAEHILQAIQVFVLHWPRPEARGALGMVFPWLVTSETLHYGYA